MAKCDLCDSCFFFNKQTTDMPLTITYLKGHYCYGRFTECALHIISKVYGQDKVPRNLYPNDTLETLNHKFIEPFGILDMFLKVIYPDGTSGMVKAIKLQGLMRLGEIIAYLCAEGWVEVRRKQKIGYRGQERRVHSLGT
jgi:hypothetical protein